MRTMIRLFFSFLVGVSIYSCKEETESVTDLDGNVQLKLDGRPLSMDSFNVDYSETNSKHELTLNGFYTDFDSVGFPLKSEFIMKLTEKLTDFNLEFDKGILQEATYSAMGIPAFKQDTKLISDLFETGDFREYPEGFVFLTEMDPEELTISGFFNLLSTDSTVLKGNFYKVQYLTE